MFNSVYVSVLKGTVHPKIKSPSSSVVEENAAVFFVFFVVKASEMFCKL